MQDRVLVSVIVPFYNAAAYLEECLDSILGQSYERLEIILIDDGSEDTSTEIAQRYAAKDDRVCLIRQENMGAGAARNKGLESASGEYVLFFDSDDYMSEEAIYSLVDRAKEINAQIVIGRSREYRLKDSTFVDMDWALRFDLLPTKPVFNYKDMGDHIFGFCVGWAWDKLYKRDFIMSCGLRFQEIRSSNDLYFVFSSLVEADSISVVDRVLFCHRTQNPYSIENSRDKVPLIFFEALYAWRLRLIHNGTFERVERSLVNWSLNFCLWHLQTLGDKAHLQVYKALKKELKNLGIAKKPETYFLQIEDYNKMRYILSIPLMLHKKCNPSRILSFKKLLCHIRRARGGGVKVVLLHYLVLLCIAKIRRG